MYAYYLVFSAHAEVVPATVPMPKPLVCILRARGGSSQLLEEYYPHKPYSPRTRR